MLRSLSLSLSALAVALSSVNVPVNAKPLSSFLLDLNLPENQASFSPLLSQAPETIPEVIVDTIPIDSPSSSSSGEDIVVESPSTPTSTSSDRRFTCESNQGQYTVMYNPQSQPNESYPWAIPQQMGGNWSAERRCREISQRLENYRPDGLLELQTGVMNNENVVCVTSQDDPSCRIVFTVPRGQDPIATRDRVFDNLADANQGRATQGVTTFTSNLNLRDLLNGNRNQTDESINLRPFLDQADGGTGEALKPQSSPRQLNPSLFQ